MPEIVQPPPRKFVPVRKTEAELKAERVAEVQRQLKFLRSDAVDEWKAKFPEKWEADVKRLKDELSARGKKEKVEKKEDEPEEKPKRRGRPKKSK